MSSIAPQTRSPQTRSLRAYAAHMLLLIPLAVGALWVAKHASHGNAENCFFDEKGEWATFKWYHYSITGNELRLRSFHLESGNQVSIERRLSGIVRGDASWAINATGNRKFKLYQWGEDPSTSQEAVEFSVQAQNSGAIVPQAIIDDFVLVLVPEFGKTRFVLIDPKTSEVADQMVEDGRLSLYPSRQTDFFELFQGEKRIGKRLKVEAKKLKVEVLANALDFVSPRDEFGQSYTVGASSDGKSMEVRSSEDYTLRSAIELPPHFMNPLSVNYYSGATWVSLNSKTALPGLTLDILTGKVLPVPTSWSLWDRNRLVKRMLVVSPEQRRAKLIDEESELAIAEFEGNGKILSSKFIADGREILLATGNQRVMRIDAQTGKVLKLIAPYWYIPYLEAIPAFAYFCWACSWLRLTASSHRHAWIDAAIVTGLCIGYILLRTSVVGFPGDAIRPIYQLAEGIFASWLMLSSLWLVLGRTRLSLRILPQIGVAGLIILIALICVGFQNPSVWELVIATVLLAFWLVIVFVPLRFMGYKFLFIAPVDHLNPTENLGTGAIPIRDLFLLTTVLAGVFALGRFAPPGLQLTVLTIVNLFVLVFSVTFTGLAAARFGMSRKRFSARLFLLLTVMAFALTVPLLWSAIFQGWQAFTSPDLGFMFWELRLHTSTVLATVLCLYAFRLRGWRLTRTPLLQ